MLKTAIGPVTCNHIVELVAHRCHRLQLTVMRSCFTWVGTGPRYICDADQGASFDKKACVEVLGIAASPKSILML